MASQSDEGHSSSRFHSLLQPLKDLAANWDIDIAESLNDYLDELSAIRVSFDQGKTTLNFAEAALLIQGSTAIYSKKVEYLHQLVLRSIEFITQKKTSNRINSTSDIGGDGMNDDTNDDHLHRQEDDILYLSDDLNLLLLDHMIIEGQNIDLRPITTSSTVNSTNKSTNGQSIMVPGSISFSDPSRARLDLEAARHSVESVSLTGNTSRISMSLMHSLLSEDAGAGGAGALKLAGTMIDHTGALLLGGSLAIGLNPRQTFSTTNTARHSLNPSTMQTLARATLISEDIAVAVAAGDEDAEEYFAHIDAENHIDDDGYFYDGDDGDQAPPALAPHSPVRGSRVEDSTDAVRRAAQRAAELRKFALLDPHSMATGTRPARRGRPYRIPAKLLYPNGKAARGDGDDSDLPASARQFLNRFENSKQHWKPVSEEFIPPMRGICDTTLAPILRLKQKLIRRQRMLELGKSLDALTLADVSVHHGTLLWDNEFAAVGEKAAATTEQADENEVPIAEEDDLPVIDNDYFPEDNHVDDNFDGTSPEADELAQRMDQALSEDLYRINGSSYELICKQYIDSFHRGASAFAMETQLSKRVSDWTMKLEPVLQAQEESCVFDIHEYSDSLLCTLSDVMSHKLSLTAGDNSMISDLPLSPPTTHHGGLENMSQTTIGGPSILSQDPSFILSQSTLLTFSPDDPTTIATIPAPTSDSGLPTIPFSAVARGHSTEDVCRMFLACLQLANLGNVEVVKGESDCDFAVCLLNGTRHLAVEEFQSSNTDEENTIPSSKRRKDEKLAEDEEEDDEFASELLGLAKRRRK